MTAEYSPGHWLQQRRRALGLTQKELGQRVGCAAETVRKIEADARRPSYQVATLLADALELPLSEHAAFIRAARGVQLVDTLPSPEGAVTRLDLIPPPMQPSGTVTFLLADIEDSVCLWERAFRAMSSVLSRYEAIFHQHIVANNGVVFKRLGDGVCAAFACASDALAATITAQRAIQAENWGEIGPLRVRMALHIGVAVERGDDLLNSRGGFA